MFAANLGIKGKFYNRYILLFLLLLFFCQTFAQLFFKVYPYSVFFQQQSITASLSAELAVLSVRCKTLFPSGLWTGLLTCMVLQGAFLSIYLIRLKWNKVTEEVSIQRQIFQTTQGNFCMNIYTLFLLQAQIRAGVHGSCSDTGKLDCAGRKVVLCC